MLKIFSFLNLQSLFNVAIANEWLRPAARDTYKHKFSSKPIIIHDCDGFHPRTRAYVRKQYSNTVQDVWCIYVRGLAAALSYIRCFGTSIHDVCIRYNHSRSKRYGYVHQYINDYLADSLQILKFDQMPNATSLHQYQKNFAILKFTPFNVLSRKYDFISYIFVV